MTGDDLTLLREFAAQHSEPAFTALVERHIGLVHSAALRQTAGDAHLAEEITQTVFLILARKAASLGPGTILSAWLYRTARYVAADTRKARLRRLSREQEAHMQSTMHDDETGAVWQQLAPVLDEAMAELGETDRAALVLRYFENKSAREIAAALRTGEATAQKRVSRALEKLRLAFVKRGLTLTAAAVAGAVSANSVKAVPAAFIKSVSTNALAKSAAGGAASVLAAAKGGATAKTAGALGLLAAALGPLAVIFQNYLGYRIDLAAARSDEERGHVKSLFRKVALVTLGIFIPFAAVVFWQFPDQDNRLSLLATGLVLIYLPAMLAFCVTSKQDSRAYYARILAQDYGNVFPEPAWEYRSHTDLFGLPLVHIRIGDRFAVLKEPVTAWIALGNHAVGGFFALGCVAVAPVSLGWISLGLVSLGGLSLGIFTIGGIGLGIWTFFGALAIGWQALGALAMAWNMASGDIALAHQFALGRIAFAAQANNHLARQFMEPARFFRIAQLVHRHWLWLNLLWIAPSLARWWIITRKGRQPDNGNGHPRPLPEL
jgi:RNA polymerase sigma factor (sigma-70 family)